MSDPAEDPARLYAAHLAGLTARFDAALAATGHAAALVDSGPLLEIFRDDQTYAFKAHAWFKAWVPVTDVPDCFIYYEPGRAPVLLFHHPVDYWYKPAALPDAYWTPHVELKPVADLTQARAALPRDLSTTACIGAERPEYSAWGIGAINPPGLLSRLEFERALKSPYELACLRAASRLGARGHLAAAQAFARGASEFEIALAFLAGCGEREQELPYNPIVALGANAAVLHYQRLEHAAPPGARSLLIDAGAEFAGYASDITRTHARHPEFAALIERFDELQQTLCAGVHSGVDWRDVHLSAHHLVAELLQDCDIITCDAEDAVASGVSSVFLPHGVGHLLGLQVHDVGGFMRTPTGGEIERPKGHPYLRLTRVLQPGFVVTMEPGIYFIDQLLDAARLDARGAKINWARVEQLRPFGGIRIEDDLAVTEDGCENLTRDAFRSESPP